MDIIRQIASGKKNRLQESDYNLDLTYICPRIIAMAFPGSGFEIIFRNNITDVQQFIHERHGDNIQIYNLSGRTYDYKKFNNRVLDFPWEDHHSPPMKTLFEVCKSIHEFLNKDDDNVVSVHCLAGKGRTGTVICCYLLYSGLFQTAEDALEYYARKRFKQKDGQMTRLGVTQPSQRRYLYYFEKILNNWKITPVTKWIQAIKMYGIPQFSRNKHCRPYIQIYDVRTNTLIYTDQKPTQQEQKKYRDLNDPILNIIQVQLEKPFTLLGDILIRCVHHSKFKNKVMYRLAFNTTFSENNMKFYLKDLDPDSTVHDKRFPSDFCVEVMLNDYCQCTNTTQFEDKCSECSIFMNSEIQDWNVIYEVMKSYEKCPIEKTHKLLFGDQYLVDTLEIMYSPFKYYEPVIGQVDEFIESNASFKQNI